MRKTEVQTLSQLEQLYNKEVRIFRAATGTPAPLFLSVFLHHTKICSPTPAGGGNHLHGYQTSHIHAPALRFLHRGRSVADQPAHLFGAAALRQALRPGGGPPAAAPHRAESGGQVRLPNTLRTVTSPRGAGQLRRKMSPFSVGFDLRHLRFLIFFRFHFAKDPSEWMKVFSNA